MLKTYSTMRMASMFGWSRTAPRATPQSRRFAMLTNHSPLPGRGGTSKPMASRSPCDTGKFFNLYGQHRNNTYDHQNVMPSKTLDPANFGARRGATQVRVPIDGKTYDFSPLLLRDLCQCPRCVHETTNQRLYATPDIPSDVQVRQLDMSEPGKESVSILWENDAPGFGAEHETTLSISDLREIVSSGTPRSPFQKPLAKQQAWDAQSCDLPDFEYNAYMQEDTALYGLIQQLRTHGLVFITNVPGVERSVATIAERIGPVKDTFYGHTWDVRSVPQATNAAYTAQDLGFHTDLLYTQSPPHVQLLHCIQSSSVGGASVFVDAYKAAVELFQTDEDAFNLLAKTPMNFQYKHPDSNLYYATKPVLELRPLRIGDTIYGTLAEFLEAWEAKRSLANKFRPVDVQVPALDVSDCLEKVNWGPPFQAPFTLDEASMEQASAEVMPNEEYLSRKVERWNEAARKLGVLLHRPEALFERLMKPGECVLFDNTRVLHGRKAFDASDAGKSRWLRGTYVDKDPYLSKLRVLENKFGKQSY